MSMMIDYNQLEHNKFIWTDWFRTGLKRFHQKYIISNVVSFIGGALSERNLEIFAAIVEIVILFDAILVFGHFKLRQTFLNSRDGLKTYMINKRVNTS